MKTKNKSGIIAAALVGVLTSTLTPVVAQTSTNAVETAKPLNSTESPERPLYWPWTVGFGAGTDGLIGGGVSWRFSDHLGTRAGVGWTESSWDDVGIADLKYNVRLRLLSEPLTLDVYPWQKSSFRFSLGVLFNQNELSGTVSSDGTITVGGQPVEIPAGSLTMKLRFQPVNPYLTIGGNLFYFDRAHRWALAGELGVAYGGSSRVSVDRTGSSSLPDDVISEVKHRLEHYADQFQWWPIAKIAVTFSF